MTDKEQQEAISWSKLSLSWDDRSAFQRCIAPGQIARNGATLLVGASGTGKSTFLASLCGIKIPDEGSVFIAGTNIYDLPNARRDMFRAAHIGVIFQQLALLPFLNTLSNIMLPLRFKNFWPNRSGDGEQRARLLCHDLGLPEHLLAQDVGTLSVGQQQRVAIARALICDPTLILADEPTAALDRENRDMFLDLLFSMSKVNKTALLIASHDEGIAHRFSNVITLQKESRHRVAA
ncbi:MAG: ATP-binding cassette domain-containing protein [Hyphomicrobiales bacterium]